MEYKSAGILNKLEAGMRNISIVSYQEAYECLQAATDKTVSDFENNENMRLGSKEKVLYCFAGPNGSGKSTVISHFIDQGICPDYYICPDYLVEGGHRDEQTYLRAMEKAESLRKSAMEQGVSFTMETVLSSKSKLEFLLEAKELGYKIIVIYIITSNYKINIERVAIRNSQGGHDVPTEKIIARYKRCLDLMPKVIDLADCALVYDNSKYLTIPRLVQSKKNNQSNTATLEELFKDYRGEYKYTEWDSGGLAGKERFWEEEQRIAENEVLKEADYDEVMEGAQRILEKHRELFIKLAGIEDDNK